MRGLQLVQFVQNYLWIGARGPIHVGNHFCQCFADTARQIVDLGQPFSGQVSGIRARLWGIVHNVYDL
jgi:hypothetical protein